MPCGGLQEWHTERGRAHELARRNLPATRTAHFVAPSATPATLREGVQFERYRPRQRSLDGRPSEVQQYGPGAPAGRDGSLLPWAARGDSKYSSRAEDSARNQADRKGVLEFLS